MKSHCRWVVLLSILVFAAQAFATCPAAGPILTMPAENATVGFGSVHLDWDGVSGATQYDVWLRYEGDTYSSPLMTVNAPGSDGNTPAIPPGYGLYWKVVAKAPACPDQPSAEAHFHTSCPAVVPQLTNPSPNTSFRSDETITFNWTPVPGAASYDLKLTPDGGQTWDVFEEFITGTSYSTDAIPEGDWGWEIRANFDGDCDPLYSQPSNFLITNCNSQPTQVTAPSAGATVEQPFEVKWRDVAANSYVVLLRKAGANEPAFRGTTDGTSLLVSDLDPGQYLIAVLAQFDACGDVLSDTIGVTISRAQTCPDGDITLNTPTNNAEVSSPAHLSWSALPGVQFYRVWATFGDSAPAIVARTTDTSVDLGFPRGTITWFVEGAREGCASITSDERTFVVKQASDCANKPAPVLVSPIGTKEKPGSSTNPATLKWNAVDGAIGYRVWLSEDGQPFGDVTITQQTQINVDVEPGLHAWYVQALFAGCDPVRSAIAFFTVAQAACPNTAPALIAPAQNATVGANVTFRWTDVDADQYRVLISRDGGDPIVIGKTDDTELARLLLPGAYVWTVEAIYNQCPSVLSTRGHFTITRAVTCTNVEPALLAPADNASLTDNTITFSWSAVPNAIRYGVVVEIDGGADTLLGLTESTSLTRRLPFGHIEWRVIAFFGSCEPIESDDREFDLNESASCSNRAPILLVPEDGVSVPSPLRLAWTDVPHATSYKVWVVQGDATPALAATTTESRAAITLTPGRYEWFVEALFPSCPSTESAHGSVTVTPKESCGTPRRPDAYVVGQALSNTDYRVRWTPLPNVSLYEVQESRNLDFNNATTFKTDDVSLRFVHEVSGTPVQYLYRVRGISDCSDARGPYSDVVGVFVIAPRTNNASTEIGSKSAIVQKIFLPGGSTPQQFSVRSDKPWITITPSNGTLPVEGLTLTLTADPSVLDLGTNTGTIQVTYTTSANGVAANGTTSAAIPVSISLVTPVTPGGQNTPPPDALIFPIVGHAAGANDSLFESDIRVTNLTANTRKYELHFTPSGIDGTQTGQSSTLELAPNETMALDDIVASLFGTGTTSSATGMLEVRPITTESSSNSLLSSITSTSLKQLQTVASSRTYNFTPNGTFGQYIPAIPFSDFVGRLADNGAANILSLQQVSQSSAYRSNFGFAEASGQSAELQVRVYDAANTLLSTIGVSLQPREHRQINGMLQQAGINNLTDGRVEVQVLNGDGKVTAYVSSVDNKTNDPLLVNATLLGNASTTRTVVPGMAYINNGAAFWVSDLRVFNSGTTATPATLTFYPQGNPGAPLTREISINPGEIKVLDNVIGGLFEQPNGAGGSITITTAQEAPLTATARTYNQTANGTYGQFIPGVTPAQSAGLGDRALQILQLEQSTRIRTNIGLAETTGQAVTVEVSAIVPDAIATPVVSIPLAANEFRQFSLGEFGFPDAIYNARVTVKVVNGDGKVTAYGSAIDMITQDPTYVPAQ
ncbi:MAG: BACON domain-containing protein [Thermoanaerobaculia bacterium]